MSEPASGSIDDTHYRKVSVGEPERDEELTGDSNTNQFGSGTGYFSNFFKAVWQKMSCSVSNSEQEEYPEFIDQSELIEENIDSPRYRPQSIESLCRATRFTENEIKKIYRNFKSECPTGTIRQDTFKGIYAKFFPHGASSYRYAHYVFNTLDQNKLGYLNFEEFVKGLSILCRGSIEEKLHWIFCLYDTNCDGVISRDDLSNIISSVYELMGCYSDTAFDDGTVMRRVDYLFQKMDRHKKGYVTLEEFVYLCLRDKYISTSIQRLTLTPLI